MSAARASDPLGFGKEDDMDDLTAHLEDVLQRGHNTTEDPLDDPFGFGDDASELPPQGLDRYRNQAYEAVPRSTDAHPGTQSTALDYSSLTYGQLITPSSHEDQPYHRSAPTHTAAGGAPTPGQPAQPADTSEGLQGRGESSSNGGGEIQPSRRSGGGGPARGAPMHFTVTDPVKRESTGLFGFKAGHVTYLLSTNLLEPIPGYTRGTTFSVRRRFRDFVSLADTLKARFRGYFLPPRPEKNAVEGQRMTDTFVEERRVALERYLNRLAQHPVVAKSQELAVFVQSENELESCPAWHALTPPPPAGLMESTAKFSKQLLGLEQSVLDPVQAAQPTKRTSDPLRAWRETSHAMASPHTGPNGAPLPPGEEKLIQDRENLEQLRDALSTASRAAEKLVHRMDRCSSVSGDAGLSLFKLSKFEEAEGPHLAQYTGTVRQAQSLAQGYKVLAVSLVRSARIQRHAVGKGASELTALHEQLASMPPAIKGLRTREKQLLTAETLEADVEARQKQIKDLEAAGAKVLGGDPSKAKRVDDLRNDVAKLSCSITAARAEYDRIMNVNKEELARTHQEYQQDILRMAQAFANSQALTSQRLAEVWLQLAGELSSPSDQLTQVRQAVLGAQQQGGDSESGAASGDGAGGVRAYAADMGKVRFSDTGADGGPPDLLS